MFPRIALTLPNTPMGRWPTLVCSRLYNNPALSNVKIKQIFNGKVREYHAHKAVLCLESEYFLNMFTGAF
jgi:hypothetical protein